MMEAIGLGRLGLRYISAVVISVVMNIPLIEPLMAHGTMHTPASRVSKCRFEDNPENPQDPACAAAVEFAGSPQFLYDWAGIRQGDANGQHQSVVPLGELCSGGGSEYAGLDLVRDDWRSSEITPDVDGNFEFIYRASAPHSTQDMLFFITPEDWDSTQQLSWNDLDYMDDPGNPADPIDPFCHLTSVSLEQIAGIGSGYRMTCPLPARSGKHIIYHVWQRADSPEAFYACIDVELNGGDPGAEIEFMDGFEGGGPVDSGQPPVARINGPYSGSADLPINFSSSGSNDPDGTITAFSWNFGDGTSSTEPDPTHVYTSNGSYTVTLMVTDNSGLSAIATTGASVGSTSGDLPGRLLIGYWHNFINQAGYIPINQVSDVWDIVNIAFAENDPFGEPGEVRFQPAEESQADFIQGVQLLKARGQKVLISIGGANTQIQLNTIEQRDNFVSSISDIINLYGFDGMDIDLEGGSLSLGPNDTITNPQTPAVINMIDAVRIIKSSFGPGLVLTMAPETAYAQGGFSTFSGIWGAYLPLIHALRTDLTVLHVQHYNTGSMFGADGVIYEPATVDFHVALADMMITGFPAAGDPDNFFPGLRADQVAIGLPASAGAAGSGQTSIAEVQQALDCLLNTTNCDTYLPAQAHTEFRGLMTWSINWDSFAGSAFSDAHRAYLDQNL